MTPAEVPMPAAQADTRTMLVGGELEVRLEHAPPAAVKQLEHELGASSVARDPGSGTAWPGHPRPVLTVRWVDRVPITGSLRLAGLTDGGFGWDDHTFYLLDPHRRLIGLDFGEHGSAGDTHGDVANLDGGAVRAPGISDGITMTIETGVRRLPHLAELAGLLLLDSGRVMLHAASFTWRGRGILVPGWQSAGKSELLLGVLARAEACYAGDEWTVIGGPGPWMRGLPSHLHVWAWQLRQLPAVARALPAAERRRLRVLRLARGTATAAARAAGDSPLGRSAAALEGWLRNAERVRLPPNRLFGAAVVAGPVPIDHVVFPTVSRDGAPELVPLDPLDVAARMAASQAWERRALEGVHAQLRHAFPDRRWERLDTAPERELAILRSVFEGLPAHELRHPYPTDLRELARAAQVVLD